MIWKSEEDPAGPIAQHMLGPQDGGGGRRIRDRENMLALLAH